MKKFNKYIILIFLFFISILFFVIHIQKDANNKKELKYIKTKINEFNKAKNIKEYGEIKYDYFDINYELIKINNKIKMVFTVNNTDISETFIIYKNENIYYLYIESEDKYIQLPNIFNKDSKSILDFSKMLIEGENSMKILREDDLVRVTISEGEMKSDMIIQELKNYEQVINTYFVKNKYKIKSKWNQNKSIYSIDMKVTDRNLNVKVDINGIVINFNVLKNIDIGIDINIDEKKIVPLEEYLYIH